MMRAIATSEDWDDYYRWVRYVWQDWRPTMPPHMSRLQCMGILWGIVQSGTAGKGCGVGDATLARQAGVDRTVVWRYRRFLRDEGILCHNGSKLGRVRLVNIVVRGQQPSVPAPLDVVRGQQPSARMLSGDNTNMSLNKEPLKGLSKEHGLEGTLSTDNIPLPPEDGAKAPLAGSVEQDHLDFAGKVSLDDVNTPASPSSESEAPQRSGGAERNGVVPSAATCTTCNGAGGHYAAWDWIPCADCDGAHAEPELPVNARADDAPEHPTAPDGWWDQRESERTPTGHGQYVPSWGERD